jgi:hypothetical protein
MFRRAASLSHEIADTFGEGLARFHLGKSLRTMGLLSEARIELTRGIEFDSKQGHASLPWMAWNELMQLETDARDISAASEAKRNAIDSFLNYRRDGGENSQEDGKLSLLIYKELSTGNLWLATWLLDRISENSFIDPWMPPFILALKRVVAGSRDQAIADPTQLSVTGAAEIRWMIEKLITDATTQLQTKAGNPSDL